MIGSQKITFLTLLALGGCTGCGLCVCCCCLLLSAAVCSRTRARQTVSLSPVPVSVSRYPALFASRAVRGVDVSITRPIMITFPVHCIAAAVTSARPTNCTMAKWTAPCVCVCVCVCARAELARMRSAGSADTASASYSQGVGVKQRPYRGQRSPLRCE